MKRAIYVCAALLLALASTVAFSRYEDTITGVVLLHLGAVSFVAALLLAANLPPLRIRLRSSRRHSPPGESIPAPLS